MKIRYLVLVAIAIPLFAGPAIFEEATPGPNPIAREAMETPRPLRQGDTLKYDLGSFTSGLGITGSGSPGADTTIGFATFFVLSEFGITDPSKVHTILLHFNSIYGTDFRLYVWDDVGGVPNSHGTHLYSNMAAPLGTPGTWTAYDLSGDDVNLPDTFWVGICYNTLANPSDWYLSYDGATPDNHTYGNLAGGAGDWVPMGNYGYGYVYGVRVVVEPAGGPAPFWDFETGWQGWTHTSGNTFPAAWGVVETTYPGGPYWTYQPPPDAGDSAFIIDSDSAGSGTWVVDTAMSPVIYNEGYSLLKWGFYLENDELQVLLREWDGSWGAWNVVASYSGDTGPAWDSADVSGYAGDSLQCAFQYDDGDAWLYGATFDNVGFYMGADVDVGASDIASPAATILPDASITPTATYNNYGSMQETFDCYFAIDSSGTNIYNETASVMLDPGADTTIMWPTWTSGPDGVTYDVMAYTVLAGDQNPGNDTLAMTSTTTSWLYWDDGAPANAWAWTYALNGWGVQFMAPDTVYVDSFAVYIYDASWPTPGSDLSTFRIYDGASEPTNIRQEWIDATIVRGAWNKFPTDTTLTQFGTGENIYMMWFQPADYPNTPGLACDAAIDYGAYQWWYNDPDTWGTGALSGDWMIRVHIVAPPEGISEWIDYTPNELSMSVAGISRNSIAIRFTLPHTSMTNLVLYDATGRRLETLVSNTLNAGIHQYTTDLDLAAGVYFVTLTTDNETITQKSLIVK